MKRKTFRAWTINKALGVVNAVKNYFIKLRYPFYFNSLPPTSAILIALIGVWVSNRPQFWNVPRYVLLGILLTESLVGLYWRYLDDLRRNHYDKYQSLFTNYMKLQLVGKLPHLPHKEDYDYRTSSKAVFDKIFHKEAKHLTITDSTQVQKSTQKLDQWIEAHPANVYHVCLSPRGGWRHLGIALTSRARVDLLFEEWLMENKNGDFLIGIEPAREDEDE